MKAIICDRCGKVETEEQATEISFPYSLYLGDPTEQHLCVGCRMELSKWMEEGATHEHER